MDAVNLSNNCTGVGTAHFQSDRSITGSLLSNGGKRCSDNGKTYDVTGSWTPTSSGADVNLWQGTTGHVATGAGSFTVTSSTHRITLTR